MKTKFEPPYNKRALEMWRGTGRKLHSRKYSFNVKVSEGARVGVTAVSGLASAPHREDGEQGIKL